MAVHKLPKPLDEEIVGIAKALEMPIGVKFEEIQDCIKYFIVYKITENWKLSF